MIARVWHGTTGGPVEAGRYEAHLKKTVIPELASIAGHRGVYVMKRPGEGGIDFMVVTLWESIEAIGTFAGEDVEAAVVALEAQALLSTYEGRARHYEVVLSSHP